MVKVRPFGKTNLNVTPLGLGLAALGRPGYINLGHADDLGRDYALESMERHAHSVMDAAWDAGIRYFDAARSYGRAEQFISTWLAGRGIPPEAVTVGSKWGYTYTADWQVEADKHEVKEHSLPVLERQIGESRALLGGYLRIYQVHSATLDSGILSNQEVLARLAALRDEGVVIGLSLSGPNQGETLLRAMDITQGGRPLFRSVQATWNLLAREVGPALAAAHEAGMGVIVKESLANGRLTHRNDDPAFAPKRALLDAAARELSTTIDAVALAAVLAQPWASVVLSGAATVEQLRSNVNALAIRWSSDLDDQLQALVEAPDAYWRQRSDLQWN